MKHAHIITHTLAAAFLLSLLTSGCAGDPSQQAAGFTTDTVSAATDATRSVATRPTGCVPLDRNPDIKVRARKGRAFVMRLEGMELSAAAGAVLHDGTYTATALNAGELPPLPTGQINVTAGSGAGYRLLPGGDHFEPHAELRVAYDERLLPRGYTPEDIHTSYYDARENRWKRLPRKEVDTARREIVSLTTHFTDFINEVLKAPEMPETQAFVPTAISELKAADPMEGAPVIQPPAANNGGTASLSYPLQIPAGRQGMQPSLALTYSSGGGCGWLGVGWDLVLPSIAVETRWGVPRYSASQESETYLLNGEQLVAHAGEGTFHELPHRTATAIPRLPDGALFSPRIDEAFDSIVRHGTSPDSYWWSVTHKNGVTDYYGKSKTGDSADHRGGVLASPSGDIAKWMLTESRDLSGNSVLYYYDTVWDSGVEGGSVKGVQIYPAYITYTNRGADTGRYRVEFVREDNHIARARSRSFQDQEPSAVTGPVPMPVGISCRYGFKEVTSSLLSYVLVTSADSAVREYVFAMKCDRGTSYKPLLTSVQLYATPHLTSQNSAGRNYGTKGLLYRGDESFSKDLFFEYYGAPERQFGNVVDLGEVWSEHRGVRHPYNMDVQSVDFAPTPAGNALLSSLKTTAIGSSKGIGWNVGGGVSVGLGFSVFWTEASAGGSFSHSHTRDRGASTLIDIDGDGLPDKVFKDILGRVKYRKHLRLSDSTFVFGDAVELTSVDDFLETTGSSTDWGLQLSLGLSATGSKTTSDSYTTTYFADVNADGLPDLVTDGGVLFNDIVGGVPLFRRVPSSPSGIDTVTTSTMPCGGILYSGDVSDSLYCASDLQFKEQTYYVKPSTQNIDSVIRRDFDGNGYTIDSKVYSAPAPPYQIHVTGHRYTRDCDRRSGETSGDIDMDAVRVWVAPFTGTVTLTDSIRMLADSAGGLSRSRYADGVRYSVRHYGGIHTENGGAVLASSHSEPVGALSGSTAPRDTLFAVSDTALTVAAGDIILFRLQSGSNRSFDRADWRHDIRYADAAPGDDPYGRPYDSYNSAADFIVSGTDHFQAPADGTVRVTVSVDAGALNGDVAVSAYLNNAATPFHSRTVTSGTRGLRYNVSAASGTDISVSRSDSIRIVAAPVAGQSNWGNFVCRAHYEFAPHPGSDLKDTMAYDIAPDLRVSYPASAGLLRELFGPIYRGWGQFAYFAEGTDPDAPIDLRTLVPFSALAGLGDTCGMKTACDGIDPESLTLEQLSGELSRTGNYNPLDTASRWRRMEPDCLHQVWTGYGRNTVIGRGMTALVCPREYYAGGEASEIIEIDCPAPAVTLRTPHVRTHAKYTRSETVNVSASASAVGLSHSSGSCDVLSDFIDLNGDRYPDLVGEGGVQYTMPYGGLEGWARGSVIATSHSKTSSHGANVSVNGGSQEPLPMFGAVPRNQKIGSAAKVPESGGPVSGSGGGVLGIDTSSTNYTDINGDGLPDRVRSDGTVELNAGYAFLPAEPWNAAAVRSGGYTSQSTSGSGTPPFNLGKFSIGGGVSIGVSENATSSQLIDINGDGLPDRVSLADGGALAVLFNAGGGHWYPDVIDLPGISEGTGFNEGLSVSATAGGTMGFAKVTGTLNGSPLNRSFGCDRAQFADLNGDGRPDYAVSDGESDMRVRYNREGKSNLLKSVGNAMGGWFSLDYAFDAPTFDSPQGQWVMSECRVGDGWSHSRVPEQRYSYTYRNPRYDRYERVSYGYDTVVTCQLAPAGGGGSYAPYRYTVEGYRNTCYATRGRRSSMSVSDAGGRRYDEVLYGMTMTDRESGAVLGDGACPRAAYPSVEATLTNHYEGGAAALLTTAETFFYDGRHNVSEYVNWGDTAFTGDEARVKIEYLAAQPHNLTGLRRRVIVYAADSAAPLRKSLFQYGTDGRGLLSRRRDSIAAAAWAQTDYAYDAYGNPAQVTLPDNGCGQRLAYTVAYDPVVKTYPVEVRDSYGRVSRTSYSYHFGKPLKATDAAGNVIRYSYDHEGRLVEVLAPGDSANGAPYTWQAEYATRHILFAPPGHHGSFFRDIHVAMTRHYDPQHPSNPIETVTFCDGWGRPAQVKKDAAVAGNERRVVSGTEDYDALGRVVGRHDPLTEPAGHPDTSFYAATSPLRSSTAFDVLDRAVASSAYHNGAPLTDSARYGYTVLAGERMAFVRTRDANGDTSATFSDGRGLKRRVADALGGFTDFDYDALGQCVRTTDPDGFSTRYTYDMLGRVVERSHPDAGTTRTAYAPNGLVLSSIYANGDRVSFDYRYGQLVRKSHSRLPQNDVEYTYDNAGRLASVKDGSGYQEFRYDQLGNVSKNIRTFAVPNSAHTYTFTMGFTYDSWGRTLSIVYPDDEEVSYGYDAGGGLRTVKGVKGSSRRTYVSDMRYDMYGNRTRVEYGNRAVADYLYDDLQRLQRLQCRALSGTSLVAMQDVSYSYDHVGNIVGIGNTAPRWTAAGMGGTYANTYAYDPLGRLSHARGDPSKQYDFGSLGMAYSPSGRIAAKVLPFLRQSLVFGYCDIAQPHAPRRILNSAADTLTDLVWDPCGNLARTADYGVSGDGVPENVRHLFWAPENRLHTFLGAKLGGYYVYDHSGERTLKLGGTAAFMDINADILLSNAQFDDVTLYASPYLVATNKGYTKHYYAGTERLAARVGGGGIAGMSGAAAANFGPTFERKILDNAKKLLLACMDETSRHCAPNDNHCVSGIAEFDDGLLGVGLMPPPDLSKTSADVKTDLFKQAMHEAESENYPEPDVYFYHSDHLGSASWITDASGAPIQHLQYLPFGEQFVDEHTLAYQERFTFTGKERDSESGLYYFGARYHDPALLTSFLSVDPKSDKYPYLSPYAYCAWNPMKLVDPDGKDWDPTTEEKYLKPYEVELTSRINYFNSIDDRSLTEEEQSQFDECTASLNEISKLRDDPNTIYTINVGRKTSKTPYGLISYSGKSGNKDLISISVFTQLNPDNVKSYFGTIAHELKHAFQFYSGILDLIILPSGKTVGTDTQELEKECFAREGMFDGVALTNGGTIRNKYKVDPSTQGLDMTIYGNYPTNKDVPSLLQIAREKGYQIIHHQ